jgi:hypothetical protein
MPRTLKRHGRARTEELVVGLGEIGLALGRRRALRDARIELVLDLDEVAAAGARARGNASIDMKG